MNKNDPKINESIAFRAILFCLAWTTLFLESILTLVAGLNKGIFKKEILSEKTNLGFDFEIIIKS